MENKPLHPRLAAFQIDSAVLFTMAICSVSSVSHKGEPNFLVIGATQIFVGIGCLIWFLFWREKPIALQTEKTKLSRQEKLRAGFWSFFGQTLVFCWFLSCLGSSAYYETIYFLDGKNQVGFISLMMTWFIAYTINACVASLISWKITQRMVNLPVKQKE